MSLSKNEHHVEHLYHALRFILDRQRGRANDIGEQNAQGPHDAGRWCDWCFSVPRRSRQAERLTSIFPISLAPRSIGPSLNLFWLEKYWSMKNATSEGPKTFITKTAMTTAFGRLFSSSPENSNTPLTTSSNPYVNNHQTTCFRSANINAPRGHSSAQMITPLPRTTPPNASITTKGNSKIRTS